MEFFSLHTFCFVWSNNITYIWFHQAFFAVIDGHGGRAAADYVAENLGRNVVKELGNDGEKEVQLEDAIREGYQITDRGFLSQVNFEKFNTPLKVCTKIDLVFNKINYKKINYTVCNKHSHCYFIQYSIFSSILVNLNI